jgi:hypothetical protein
MPPFSLPVREIAALLVLLVGGGAGWMALRADADDPDRRVVARRA